MQRFALAVLLFIIVGCGNERQNTFQGTTPNQKATANPASNAEEELLLNRNLEKVLSSSCDDSSTDKSSSYGTWTEFSDCDLKIGKNRFKGSVQALSKEGAGIVALSYVVLADTEYGQYMKAATQGPSTVIRDITCFRYRGIIPVFTIAIKELCEPLEYNLL